MCKNDNNVTVEQCDSTLENTDNTNLCFDETQGIVMSKDTMMAQQGTIISFIDMVMANYFRAITQLEHHNINVLTQL